MKLFIDTADVAQIKETYAKTGRPAAAVYRDICAIVDGPISLETLSLTAPEMIVEGRELAKFHRNVVVKIPMTREGMKAVKVLSAEGIKTNVTVTFSPLQALLAAKCGATYISPFVGRLDSFGHNGMDLVRQIKQIYANYGYKTEIIVAAVRHPLHVLEAALAGAEVATMGYDVMVQLYNHPLTDLGIETFLKDWKKVPQS